MASFFSRCFDPKFNLSEFGWTTFTRRFFFFFSTYYSPLSPCPGPDPTTCRFRLHCFFETFETNDFPSISNFRQSALHRRRMTRFMRFTVLLFGQSGFFDTRRFTRQTLSGTPPTVHAEWVHAKACLAGHPLNNRHRSTSPTIRRQPAADVHHLLSTRNRRSKFRLPIFVQISVIAFFCLDFDFVHFSFASAS